MRARLILALAALGIVMGTTPAVAKPAGAPNVTHLPLWTAKGRPTRQFVPGLTEALLLNADQKEKLAAAWWETLGSRAVTAASRTVKIDPAATEAQKQAAREMIDAAAAELQQRIRMILTSDQKQWIEQISTAYAEAAQAVPAGPKVKPAAADGSKEELTRARRLIQDRIEADFLARINGILTAEQWAALLRAAAEEERAAAESAKAKSGKPLSLK